MAAVIVTATTLALDLVFFFDEFFLYFHYWCLIVTTAAQSMLLVVSLTTTTGPPSSLSFDYIVTRVFEGALATQLAAMAFFWAFLREEPLGQAVYEWWDYWLTNLLVPAFLLAEFFFDSIEISYLYFFIPGGVAAGYVAFLFVIVSTTDEEAGEEPLLKGIFDQENIWQSGIMFVIWVLIIHFALAFGSSYKSQFNN